MVFKFTDQTALVNAKSTKEFLTEDAVSVD
jgi:hypothetical protein